MKTRLPSHISNMASALLFIVAGAGILGAVYLAYKNQVPILAPEKSGMEAYYDRATPHPELELLSASQLTNYTQRMDLSGLVQFDGHILALGDKEWDNQLYKVEFTPSAWMISPFLKMTESRLFDWEAVDHCDNTFYLANEVQNKIYSMNPQGEIKELQIDFSSLNPAPLRWLENAGFEGLAVDCPGQLLYLAKERQPRFIVRVDLKTHRVMEQFNIEESESNDFSDLKFENGYLYLLERGGAHIAKVEPLTHKVISKVSYQKIAGRPGDKLYGPTPFGLDEALMLTPGEIWLGVDNNGLSASPRAQKDFSFKGTSPAILKFKRPSGF